MPAVYFDRASISLYDVQFDSEGKRIPIPDRVMQKVAAEFVRFLEVCDEFGVRRERIRIVATEATRTALNAKEFLQYIKEKTGLEVELLTKEQEGNVGAMGIASSLPEVRGLVMDLGGGSAQVTWIISHGGMVRTSPRVAISFPYGAAALTKRLADCDKAKDPEAEREKFRHEIRANFRSAYDELEIPEELVDEARRDGGWHIYLSGGGFRGWGYLLLSQSQKHGHEYPISIINGFQVYRDELVDTERLKKVAKQAENIFRISDRRRYQVPAVAFLINALANNLPIGARVARFCQGGVREGLLFRDLPRSIRAQDPIAVAAAPYASPSAPEFRALLLNSLPAPSGTKHIPAALHPDLIGGLANLLFHHASAGKEVASVSAMYCTITGVLASAYGIAHSARAAIALALEERYAGEMPPREERFKHSLEDLLTPEQVWWCRYAGAVGYIIAQIYPTGVVVGGRPILWLSSRFVDDLSQDQDRMLQPQHRLKPKPGLETTISVPRAQP